MKYTVTIEKPVIKFLKKHSDVASRFFEKVELLEGSEGPNHNLLDTKKLAGTSDRWRLRIGKYRFLFRVDQHEIIIYFYDADSRGDIYK